MNGSRPPRKARDRAAARAPDDRVGGRAGPPASAESESAPYAAWRSGPGSAQGAAQGAQSRSASKAGAETGAADRAPRSPQTRSSSDEVRLYGLNACRAAYDARPQDLRKVYLAESRISELRDVLAYCVRQRLGYRVVEEGDLGKLAASSHHEGVVFDMRRRAQPTLAGLLDALAPGPLCLLWLDGVGNPHNFGAVLRSAAHFGVAAVVLPPGSPLTLSGAACRIAEGGAEMVPVVSLDSIDTALAALSDAGFALAATSPHTGTSIYAARLPERVVLVFGAEGEGMQPALVDACALHLTIPGSGKVESLNIANSVSVVLGECWRRGICAGPAAEVR